MTCGISRRAALRAAFACAALGATREAHAGDPPARRDASADALDVDRVLARIATARAQLRSLRGPFVQTRTIGLLATDVESTGTMALLRPDRLRWELAPPDNVTFWVGPEGLSYRSAHGHASIPAGSARVGAALSDLQTVLGGDLQGLRQRWDLAVLSDGSAGAELEATRRISAQAASGMPRTMRFALGPDLVRPTRALLVLGPRDQTRIVFGPLVVNASFTIDPPTGS